MQNEVRLRWKNGMYVPDRALLYTDEDSDSPYYPDEDFDASYYPDEDSGEWVIPDNAWTYWSEEEAGDRLGLSMYFDTWEEPHIENDLYKIGEMIARDHNKRWDAWHIRMNAVGYKFLIHRLTPQELHWTGSLSVGRGSRRQDPRGKALHGASKEGGARSLALFTFGAFR